MVGRFQDPLGAFPKAQSQSGHGHLPGFFSVLVKALTVSEVRNGVCLLTEDPVPGTLALLLQPHSVLPSL